MKDRPLQSWTENAGKRPMLLYEGNVTSSGITKQNIYYVVVITVPRVGLVHCHQRGQYSEKQNLLSAYKPLRHIHLFTNLHVYVDTQQRQEKEWLLINVSL